MPARVSASSKLVRAPPVSAVLAVLAGAAARPNTRAASRLVQVEQHDEVSLYEWLNNSHRVSADYGGSH